MGTSTDAILFYGFCLPEDSEENDLCEDYEDIYAKVCGFPEPTSDYHNNMEVHELYWEHKKSLLLASECGIDAHCSGDYPMYFVYFSKSKIINSRGDNTIITKNTLNVEDHWNMSIKDFCDKLKITYAEPAWNLVSYWG